MIIFLPINLNMCFGCSKEPSLWDGSFEYPQHMFYMRNKENSFPIHTLIWRPDNNNNKMWFRKLNWISLIQWTWDLCWYKKEKLNKKDVLVGTEIATSCLQSSHTSIILVHRFLIFLFVLFLPTFMSQSHTDFLSTLFENSYSLALMLALQNHFHGLSSTM